MRMNSNPTYQAADAVAARIERHFARHLEAARLRDEQELAPEPDAQTIKMIIDATFWASLRHEEGHSPKISLAFVPPDQTKQPLIFEQPLPLTPATLTKLAPAVERPEIHLGVWGEGDELSVWGATRSIPKFCFVLEVIEPGLLVVKHRRNNGFGKYANVAVFKGEQVKLVDEKGASLPHCPDLLSSLESFTAPTSWKGSVNVLVQLAASMRAHGHGGSLLVVPASTEAWRDSIVHPILYSIVPPFSGLAELMKQEPVTSERLWQTQLRRTVDIVAGSNCCRRRDCD